eukprot:8368544-Prorocentrum_lima.AAC.1
MLEKSGGVKSAPQGSSSSAVVNDGMDHNNLVLLGGFPANAKAVNILAKMKEVLVEAKLDAEEMWAAS